NLKILVFLSKIFADETGTTQENVGQENKILLVPSIILSHIFLCYCFIPLVAARLRRVDQISLKAHRLLLILHPDVSPLWVRVLGQDKQVSIRFDGERTRANIGQLRITYDKIGTTYSATRRPDPRIAARIFNALGDATSVV